MLTCARMFDGSVRCWGLFFGGTERRTRVPKPRPDLGVTARIAVANDIVCVWGPDWRMRCAGGSTGLVPQPLVTEVFTDVVEVSGRGGSYCLRRSDGVPQCIGSNSRGELGVDVRARVEEFVVPHGLGPVAQIVCGGEHTCARMFDGTALCWGDDERGTQGYGLGVSRTTVVKAEGIVDLAAGGLLTCAVLGDTSLRCWSHLHIDSTINPSSRLQGVVGVTGVADVGIGANHACVLLRDGTVRCWGSDEHGQLGDGVDDDTRRWCGPHDSRDPRYCRSEPVEVAGLRDVIALAVGADHTCALTRAHAVRCWGRNEGRLGDGSKEDRHVPIEPLWAGVL